MAEQAKHNRALNYEALGEFRYQIRRFLNFSEQAARRETLEPQQHQALLVLKELSKTRKVTVGVLADRLYIQHHSAVGLAHRLEAHGLISRTRNSADHREVVLRLRPRGERLLQTLSLTHRGELRLAAPALVRALTAAIGSAGSKQHRVNSRLRKQPVSKLRK